MGAASWWNGVRKGPSRYQSGTRISDLCPHDGSGSWRCRRATMLPCCRRRLRPRTITRAGWALNDTEHAVHPTDPRLTGIYSTIWFDDLGDAPGQVHQRNVTVFADGEVDRSPIDQT
jgi:hypothetical protein